MRRHILHPLKERPLIRQMVELELSTRCIIWCLCDLILWPNDQYVRNDMALNDSYHK